MRRVRFLRDGRNDKEAPGEALDPGLRRGDAARAGELRAGPDTSGSKVEN